MGEEVTELMSLTINNEVSVHNGLQAGQCCPSQPSGGGKFCEIWGSMVSWLSENCLVELLTAVAFGSNSTRLGCHGGIYSSGFNGPDSTELR